MSRPDRPRFWTPHPDGSATAGASTRGRRALATNEYRGASAGERTAYHSPGRTGRLADVCGQFPGKGQLVDVEGRHIDRLLPGTLEHVRRREVRAVTR